MNNGIHHLRGDHWVAVDSDGCHVVTLGACVGEVDSSYARDRDGLSLAQARVDYLHKRDCDAFHKSRKAAIAGKAFADLPTYKPRTQHLCAVAGYNAGCKELNQ